MDIRNFDACPAVYVGSWDVARVKADLEKLFHDLSDVKYIKTYTMQGEPCVEVRGSAAFDPEYQSKERFFTEALGHPNCAEIEFGS